MDPNPEYSRLDRLDGLPGRDYRHLSAAELADAAAWLKAHPGRTRYDAQWPDVLAAEGGLALGRAIDLADLPADQSGFTALADWPVWDLSLIHI